jgi:hypothetical protein
VITPQKADGQELTTETDRKAGLRRFRMSYQWLGVPKAAQFELLQSLKHTQADGYTRAERWSKVAILSGVNFGLVDESGDRADYLMHMTFIGFTGDSDASAAARVDAVFKTRRIQAAD